MASENQEDMARFRADYKVAHRLLTAIRNKFGKDSDAYFGAFTAFGAGATLGLGQATICHQLDDGVDPVYDLINEFGPRSGPVLVAPLPAKDVK